MKTLSFKVRGSVLQALSSSDEKMAWLIETVGDYELDLRTDYFPSLVRSIIGQQLSVVVARTIWERIKGLCNNVTPEILEGISDEELKAAGLSRTKSSYVKDLSKRILSGDLDLAKIDSLPDQEVIRQLIQVKGIGTWTAEMFLIFSLGRPDIFSFGDLGLRRSIQWLYGYKKSPSDRTLKLHSKKWAPYRSIASLYLWEVINQGLIKNPPHLKNAGM